MDELKPINMRRNMGGTVDIGTEEDGAIVEMLTIGDRAFAIKEKAVYELLLADKIDPQRENPNLPPFTQTLVLKLGTQSEMFSRIFITAKQLFQKTFLSDTVNTDTALLLTIELLQELSAMSDAIDDYLNEEKKASAEYEERRNKNLDHAVPSITDLQTRCKTIFQKADQVLQRQMEIIRLFFPDFAQSYYTKFQEYIEKIYGEDDPFTKFLVQAMPFIELIRNIRNCVEHKNAEIEIKNYELQPNLNILTPTIQMDYKNSKLARTAIASVLPIVRENLMHIFENLTAHLSSKRIKEKRFMGGQVMFVPEDRRRNKYVKYAYWSGIGEGGYFHQ